MPIEELNEMGFEHDNGWVVGNLIQNGSEPWIVGDLVEVDDEYIVHDFWVKVHPESVGQVTGETDIKDTPIIEGDVVEFDLYGDGEKQKGVVEYKNASFLVQTDYEPPMDGTHLGGALAYELGKLIKNDKDVEIIGNTFEHSHLLEVTK